MYSSFKKKLGFVSLLTLSALITFNPSPLMAMDNLPGNPSDQAAVNNIMQGFSNLLIYPSPTRTSSFNGNRAPNPLPMSMSASFKGGLSGMPDSQYVGQYPYESPVDYAASPYMSSSHAFNGSMSGSMNPFSDPSSSLYSSFAQPNSSVIGQPLPAYSTANLSASSVTPPATMARLSSVPTVTPVAQKAYVPTKLLCPSLEEVNQLILKAKNQDGEAQDKLIDLCLTGTYATYLTPQRIGFLRWKKTPSLEHYLYNNDKYMAYCVRRSIPVNHFPKLPEMVQKRAEPGNTLALDTLGLMYRIGYGGVEKNPQKAIECYTKSSSSYSKSQLSHMYSSTSKEVPPNPIQAFEFLKQAADQGRLSAQAGRGCIYETGNVQIGVQKNAQEAVEWYTKAALRGHDGGQYLLGFAYERGFGVAKDLQQATEWYRQSAMQGHVKACHRLGVAYQNGIGVDKNLMTAVGYQMVGQNKLACPFLSSQVSSTPVLNEPQESWAEKLKQMIGNTESGLTFLVTRHRQKIAEEQQQEFKAPDYINLYEEALKVEEEALQIVEDFGYSKLGMTLVPNLEFSEATLKDYPKQPSPQQVYRCEVDGVSYCSFGTDNIANHTKLLAYRKQVKEKFKVADKALKKLAKVFYNQTGYETAQATLRQLRQDPAKKEDCQLLTEKINKFQGPLKELEKEREELAKVRDHFRSLPHSIGQESLNEFLKYIQG